MGVEIKNAFLNETTTFPVALWVPASGKQVRIYNVHVNISNHSTGKVTIGVRFLINNQIITTFLLCVESNQNFSMNFPITVKLTTDPGDGVTPTVDVQNFSTTSTSFSFFISVIGEEI